ncbi:hypothetical protein [Empedobacter sp.]|uniref:hypothetical protein n=1 Tax=Empedobacter sp. TaxID=1927715 RepID=UPI00289B228E|nr:hypothetical protein [Empedobacter sp.]
MKKKLFFNRHQHFVIPTYKLFPHLIEENIKLTYEDDKLISYFNDSKNIFEKYFYDEENRLITVINTESYDPISETYQIDFIYFSNKVIRTKKLIESSNANDSIQNNNEFNGKLNTLLETDTCDINDFSYLARKNIYFHYEIDYKILEFQYDELIISEDNYNIYTEVLEEIIPGKIVISKKKYKKFNDKIPMLIELDLSINKNENYDSDNDFIDDSSPDLFIGMNRFGYDTNCKLNYLENSKEIAIITHSNENNIKHEICNVINKKNFKITPWFEIWQYD